jgi:hypothetical protein
VYKDLKLCAPLRALYRPHAPLQVQLVDQRHNRVQLGHQALGQKELPARAYACLDQALGGQQALAKGAPPPAEPVGILFQAEKTDLARLRADLARPLRIALVARQAPDAEQFKTLRRALVAQLTFQFPQPAIVGREIGLAVPGGHAQALEKGPAFARVRPLAELAHDPAQGVLGHLLVGRVAQPAVAAAIRAARHVERDRDPWRQRRHR